ncbi:MAG: REP-associated tyrosine transposase [Armatimonadota bacterium]
MSGFRVYADEDAPYFITSTTLAWAHVFTSPRYFEVLIDAFAYCRRHKGLRIYGYVVMTNHFHLVAHPEVPGALAGIIRDLKRHTSSQILQLLREDGQESLLRLLSPTSSQGLSTARARVWQEGFHPVLITSEEWLRQKITYVEANPVRKGYVELPEHWRYSSARNRMLHDHSLLEIDDLPL